MTSAPNAIPGPKTQTLGLDANVAALLCYVPVFPVNVGSSILWLMTEPRTSRFVRFHAAQALTLFVGSIVILGTVGIGGMFLTIALAIALGDLGVLFSMVLNLVLMLLGLGAFVLVLMGMIKAYQGQEWEMPIVGPIARRFA